MRTCCLERATLLRWLVGVVRRCRRRRAISRRYLEAAWGGFSTAIAVGLLPLVVAALGFLAGPCSGHRHRYRQGRRLPIVRRHPDVATGRVPSGARATCWGGRRVRVAAEPRSVIREPRSGATPFPPTTPMQRPTHQWRYGMGFCSGGRRLISLPPNLTVVVAVEVMVAAAAVARSTPAATAVATATAGGTTVWR